MFNSFLARLKQGYHTTPFPNPNFSPFLDFQGEPVISKHCNDCKLCHEKCPTQALRYDTINESIELDLGKCTFCGECAKTCPKQVITFSKNYIMAARNREDLIIGLNRPLARITPFPSDVRSLLSHSCKFREVSAGGCNACESDSNVLTTIGWDISRYGYSFVASPRHADAIWLTGPLPANMQDAFMITWESIPSPKLLIAVGACAISGGLFYNGSQLSQGATPVLTPDLFIPGCPPHPATILHALLSAMGRIDEKK